MSEETLPVGGMEEAQKAAEGAGAQAPASGAGAQPEPRKATGLAEQAGKVVEGAETQEPTGAAPKEAAPEVSEEAMRIASEARRRSAELDERETELRMQDMERQIAAEKDPQRRFQLAAQYEAQVMLQTDAYMTQYARQHGIDPGDALTRAKGLSGDQRINWSAGSQAEFEASVLRAANEDQAKKIADLETEAQRVQALEADLPNLVETILANRNATGRRVDPGDGGGRGAVKDWTTATPEQVQQMREELRRRG